MRQPEPEKVAAGSPERIIVQTATFLPEDCPLKITNKTIAMYKRLVTILAVLFCGLMASAQDVKEVHQLNYDPEKLKIVPDKVFEFGIPLLFVFLLINAIITILKNRAEFQLKAKMIEKGVSEESLVSIFRESNAISRLQPLKWFLFTLASAMALLVIHFSRDYLVNQSGYLAVGIFLFFLSAAFLAYFQILKNRQ